MVPCATVLTLEVEEKDSSRAITEATHEAQQGGLRRSEALDPQSGLEATTSGK
jgi:hypothetical protein